MAALDDFKRICTLFDKVVCVLQLSVKFLQFGRIFLVLTSERFNVFNSHISTRSNTVNVFSLGCGAVSASDKTTIDHLHNTITLDKSKTPSHKTKSNTQENF